MKNSEITEDNQSMYCYPGTSILINRYDIKDKEKLSKLENMLVTYKLANLIDGKGYFKRDLTIEHYLKIHEYLFDSEKQSPLISFKAEEIILNHLGYATSISNKKISRNRELYTFGGQIRKEFTNKTNCEIEGEEGLRIYCPPEHIYEQLDARLKLMKKLAVKVATRKELVNFLAEQYMELYFIHPFREGNSRTLREFLREYVELMNKHILRIKTYKLDYTNLSDENRQKFIKATIWNISSDKEKQQQSLEILKEAISECLVEYEIEEKQK